MPVLLVPVNFDIEVIKPGCGGVPTFNYARKLQFTLVLVVLSALLFALACTIRLCLRARAVTRTVVVIKTEEMDHELDDLADDENLASTGTAEDAQGEEGQAASSPGSRALPKSKRRASSLWKGLTAHQRRVMERSAQLSMVWLDFKHRLCHALLILLSIFYLQLTTLLFQALVCDLMPNPTAPTDSKAVVTESLYLRKDGQTACWTGSHISTAAGAIILLVVYSLGFPLFCFVMLTRAFTGVTSTGLIGWLRKNISWLRSGRDHLTFAVARAAMQQAANAGEAVRPSSPSRGGWLQDNPATLTKAPSVVPAVSSEALMDAAKLQRRRESANKYDHIQLLSYTGLSTHCVFFCGCSAAFRDAYGFLFLSQ